MKDVRKTLCTVLPGISKDKIIPSALPIPIPLLVFYCNAVLISSTAADANGFLSLPDLTLNVF